MRDFFVQCPSCYRCRRRICRVLPTCSTVYSCPLPLQPQNLSGAAYLFGQDKPHPLVQPHRVCLAVRSCPLPLQVQNLSGAAYLLGWHESQPIKRTAFVVAESVGCFLPVRTGQNPADQTRRLCRRRICRVLPTCSDRTNPIRSYNRTAPVFLTKTYKNSPAGAVSAITFCSTTVPMPLP